MKIGDNQQGCARQDTHNNNNNNNNNNKFLIPFWAISVVYNFFPTIFPDNTIPHIVHCM